MDKYRSFIVWGAAAVLILAVFLGFVLAGWTGEPDKCIDEKPTTCYCEDFNRKDVLSGAPGVRQPVNTWFNLYAIGTSFLVALFVYFDRERFSSGGAPNLIRSTSLAADLYVFAVLFLGLGSMWFHASLTKWGGILDGVSMYVYAAFLFFYTIRRFWDSAVFFWVGYFTAVILFTFLHAVGVPSLINIIILVAAYLAAEVYIWIRTGKIMQGKPETIVLWVFAALSILAATFFWAVSQTGNFMCDPKSFFQPHGLLWHPLAGVMAVLLYFYWRAADDPV
ncbi:MAG TPA: ceramidase domain-containing protein [Pyrinomonadaceae bacterium]|nr:ceramidase domain-containing protein [Pyrinomonadaceae bacterium]